MNIIERLIMHSNHIKDDACYSLNMQLMREAANEIERLRAGYKRLKESSDSEMCDGDLARDIADEMLTPNV